jgi:hypothetical protein
MELLMLRRRFKQTIPLDQRLMREADRLRKQADDISGIEKDWLIRRARHVETAARMDEWLKSPGLRSPN